MIMKTDQELTVITEPQFNRDSFTSRLRGIGALALSAIPIVLGTTSCENSIEKETFRIAEAKSIAEGEQVSSGEAALESQSMELGSTTEFKKAGTVKIIDEIIVSDGKKVKANPSGYYGHGYIVGSPINSGDTGVIFSTYEVHINQGSFPDDPSYLGSDVHFSIDGRNSKVFDAFQEIEGENQEQFVFEYVRKHPVNPEIEGSSLFMLNARPLDEFMAELQIESIPRGVRAKTPWGGSSGTKTKVGRIVDIERYGQLANFCVIEVNMSGLTRGTEGGGEEKLVKLTVKDEDIAAWCEKAIALGRDVEIKIAQDIVEFWEPSSMVVTQIQFKDTAPRRAVTPEQYEAVREMLMNDPIFLESLKQQLGEGQSGK